MSALTYSTAFDATMAAPVRATFRNWMLRRPTAPPPSDTKWVERFVAWCVEVPDAEMRHFHHPDWIEYVRPIVYSEAPFNPVKSDRTFVFAKHRVVLQSLPNATYRALLLHLLRRIPTMSPHERTIVRYVLMAMEENGITGYVYVPRDGPARHGIRDVALVHISAGVPLERGYMHVPETNTVVRAVVLCNTSVVWVLNAYLRETDEGW